MKYDIFYYFELFPHFARCKSHSFTFPPTEHARCLHTRSSVSTKYFNLFYSSTLILTSTCAHCNLLLTGDVFNLILCQISIILFDFLSQNNYQKSATTAKRTIQLITKLRKRQNYLSFVGRRLICNVLNLMLCIKRCWIKFMYVAKSPANGRKSQPYGLNCQPQHFFCRHGNITFL